MTIKDFNSKLQSSLDNDKLVDSVRRLVSFGRITKSAFEDELQLGWPVWDDGGGVAVTA